MTEEYHGVSNQSSDDISKNKRYILPNGASIMKNAVAIALFCAGGGLTRYYLSGLVYRICGATFPFGTLAVNILGSYLIGVIMELGLRSSPLQETIRVGLTVGFLGGLTTFSTFSHETFKLLESGQLISAITNVLASIIFCLLFTWLGIMTVRSLA